MQCPLGLEVPQARTGYWAHTRPDSRLPLRHASDGTAGRSRKSCLRRDRSRSTADPETSIRRQREVVHLERRIRATGRYELDTVIDRTERGGGRDPPLADDVVEEREQIEGPRGDVVGRHEGDVAAALVDVIARAVERDGIDRASGRNLVVVISPDLKWTPKFGPAAKVGAAPWKRSRSREEHPHPSHR